LCFFFLWLTPREEIMQMLIFGVKREEKKMNEKQD
jgi:hypothetical protein